VWVALYNKRPGLPYTIAADPRQRSHSRVRVPRDLRPYFTVPDSVLLYRRATRHVLTRDAKGIDVDGGIFENVLY
jgi:hypothetical protein